jgi:hypothetical protein
MLLYNHLNNKLFFAFLVLLFYFVDQNYLAFIVGIIAAIIANKECALSKPSGVLLVFSGCFLGLFPLVLLPSFMNVITLYSVGAGFVIVGTHCCFSDHRLLCNKLYNRTFSRNTPHPQNDN